MLQRVFDLHLVRLSLTLHGGFEIELFDETSCSQTRRAGNYWREYKNEEEKVWWMPEMDQHASGPLTHQPHQSNLPLHLTLTHVSELCLESTDKYFMPEGCVKCGPVITTTKEEAVVQ